ncbi:MAG: S9 family peptidase [Cyanobacteria bacterium P01_G01_bin.19]
MTSNVQPPSAKKISHITNHHGIERIDDYHWLRDDNWQKFIKGDIDFKNQQVFDYINAENKYTETVMEDTAQLQEDLYQEMLSRLKEDDDLAPMKHGQYFYYARIEKGKDYFYYCRKKESLEATEEIYFDVNAEAQGRGYYSLGALSRSEGDRYLAYSENTTGSMEYTVKVRDLESGGDFPWEVKETTGGLAWCRDYQHLYYIERDPQDGRGRALYRFPIQAGPKQRELIFERPDHLSHLFMSMYRTSDRNYIVLEFGDTNANQLYLIDARDSNAQPILFHELEKDTLVSLESGNGRFYILTNSDRCINNKIMTCPEKHREKENWSEYIAHNESTYIENIDLYHDYLVMVVNDNKLALPKIVVRNIVTGKTNEIEMKDEAYSLGYLGALEFESKTIQFSYQSPIRPSETQEYNFETESISIVKPGDCPNFNPDNYEVRRVFAPAHDGEEIPLTIVSKKGFIQDGQASAFIYGYGSYGYSMPAYFSSNIMSLVDRGFSYATAHIRGGSDRGYRWYLDGKMDKKMNTFWDFISCCRYLIDHQYCSEGKIIANGGSAGGLLMGAITNMAPELFQTVILDVPFVDVINTICDETLPLTPPEWNEWGNPILDKEVFEYMLSYSPYDNVESKEYPNMLFNSGITDEQVTYWEPAKMVAKLRELKRDNNLLLLKIKMTAGHAGSSARYTKLREKAFDYAFILKVLLDSQAINR